MKVQALSLVASLPALSSAFVAPRSAHQPKHQLPPPRHTVVAVFDQMGISEDSSSTLLVEEAEASARLAAPPPSSVLDKTSISEDDDDLGKAIFLANAEENADILGIMEDDGLVSNLSLEDASLVTPTPMETESVNAILAASEKAAALAEASLSRSSSETNVDDVLASSVDQQEPSSAVVVQNKPLNAPSVTKILKFAVPAIGVWLCSPMLSLIDTSAVGILSGTVQQAALNPAVAVTDYAALLIAFMYTGATNLIAAAREHDEGVPGAPRTTKSLIGALQLSTYVGLGLGLTLFTFARPLLRGIIGNDGISPAVFNAAIKYVRIRAIGMPAAAMIGSAQAACLGMQDIKSPLYVLLAAAVVNFCGDMLFVGCSHPMIGGAAGAAWATVFSQYAAVSLFVHWLCHKPKKAQATTTNVVDEQDLTSKTTLNISDAILKLTGKPLRANKSRPKKQKEESFTVRGFLDGKLKRKRELVQFPPRSTTDEFAPYVVPVTSQQVGRVSGYIAMSHVVSSSLGTVSMAAQQVIVSLFYCLCPIADSLSLTAQSFMPSISEKKASPARSKALRQTIINFMKAGGVFGAVMMSFVSCIPLLSGFFTTDPMVSSLVNMVVPLLLGFFSVHGVLCASEGLLLGQKDLGFLGKMYGSFFAVLPLCMLRVKKAALADTVGKINLTSVWTVFLGYQMFRFVAWVARVGVLQRRTERALPVTATSTAATSTA